jgi:hypothetical protein
MECSGRVMTDFIVGFLVDASAFGALFGSIFAVLGCVYLGYRRPGVGLGVALFAFILLTVLVTHSCPQLPSL